MADDHDHSNSAPGSASSPGAKQPSTEKNQQEQKQPETPEQRRKKHRLWLLAGMAVAFLIVIGVAWYALFKRGRISTDDAYTDGRAILIAAKVSGYVDALTVQDNQPVKAGALLLKIDPRDYRSALDSANGQLQQLQAQLEAARSNLAIKRTSSNSDLTSALALREEAHANNVKAQADLKRQQGVDPRATTPALTDQANAQAKAAAMQLRDAEAKVNTARLAPQDISIAEAQVRQLEGQVAAAQAQVQQAQLNLDHTEIRAPQDGRVTRRNIEQGSYVQPSQSLLSLVTPEVWVTANFKENQLADMKPGQPVKIAVDAFPQLKLRGHVDSMQMGSGSRFAAFPTENATGNFVKIVQRVPVKIVVDQGLDPNLPLPLGVSVVPTVDVR